MLSPKMKLIIQDIESWAITSLLFLAPIVLEQAIQLLANKDLGVYGTAAAFALGSLLKLAQKWKQTNNY
jgi:hypothetical protein